MKRLAVDLVIVNERASSYVQDLQIAIETAVRSSQSRPALGDVPAQGAVYTLRADLMSVEARALLQSAARVVAASPVAGPLPSSSPACRPPSGASVPRQTSERAGNVPLRQPSRSATARISSSSTVSAASTETAANTSTVLERARTTPAPWINVIANPGFGFQVSAEGSGYTWAENSRENQLTPWSNDPVERSGRRGDLRPRRGDRRALERRRPSRSATTGIYVARHGFGYSRFEHEAHGIALDLLQYVPLADPIKISRLTLRNRLGRAAPAVGHRLCGMGARHVARRLRAVRHDGDRRRPPARCWRAIPGASPFRAGSRSPISAGQQTAWTADRTEFLGRNGGLARPRRWPARRRCPDGTGAGLDPCAALQTSIELGVGETREVVWLPRAMRFGRGGARADRPLPRTDLDTVLGDGDGSLARRCSAPSRSRRRTARWTSC